MPMYVIWGIIIVLFAVFEGITAQLVSIWFVFGGIAGLIAALANANVGIQIAVFVIVSILCLIATRPIVKKHLNTKITKTNADRCIGKDAVVIERVDNLAPTGQVKVDGTIWTAKSIDDNIIEKDSIVKIEKIEGVKLLVKSK